MPLTEPPRNLWTRAECFALEVAGALDCRRLELIDGDLIDKAARNWAHASAQEFLHLWFIEVFGAGLTTTEATIDASPEDNPTSEPIPDLVVLKRSISSRRQEPDSRWRTS